MLIHPTAVIDAEANLAEDVEVGPWSVIGAKVSIGVGSKIKSHVVIEGPTNIGKHNVFHPFSSIGCSTPDIKYEGEETTLTIGDYNIFREGVTVHRGTVQDRGDTAIGNHNLFMSYAHVGHDSVIHNHTILVNNVLVAGHTIIKDWAVIGGGSGVNQHSIIGEHCFIAGMVRVKQDVLPFVLVGGNGNVVGINKKGLLRRGINKEETLKILNKAFRLIYKSNLTLKDAVKELETLTSNEPLVQLMIDAINESKRGILR